MFPSPRNILHLRPVLIDPLWNRVLHIHLLLRGPDPAQFLMMFLALDNQSVTHATFVQHTAPQRA